MRNIISISLHLFIYSYAYDRFNPFFLSKCSMRYLDEVWGCLSYYSYKWTTKSDSRTGWMALRRGNTIINCSHMVNHHSLEKISIT